MFKHSEGRRNLELPTLLGENNLSSTEKSWLKRKPKAGVFDQALVLLSLKILQSID
jgi:hypothetical protein